MSNFENWWMAPAFVWGIVLVGALIRTRRYARKHDTSFFQGLIELNRPKLRTPQQRKEAADTRKALVLGLPLLALVGFCLVTMLDDLEHRPMFFIDNSIFAAIAAYAWYKHDQCIKLQDEMEELKRQLESSINEH